MNCIHPQRRANRRSGFTLIEVLFATLAFSIVLAAINSVFYSSIRLRERVSEKHATFKPRMQALQYLKKDLRATFYSEGFRANQFLAEAVTGSTANGDRLQFFTSSGQTREEAPWSDVQRVEYYLAPTLDPRQDPNSLDLVRAVTRNILTSVYQPPIEQRLVHGLSAFNLTFFDGEVWQETWDSTLQDPVLPKAVQVYLEFDDNTPRGQLPPSLTQMVSILAEPRVSEDEEGEDGTGGDEGSNDDSGAAQGGGTTAPAGGGGGGAGGGGGNAGGGQGQQGGRN